MQANSSDSACCRRGEAEAEDRCCWVQGFACWGGRCGSCPRPAGKVLAETPAVFLQKPPWLVFPSMSSVWERSWDLSVGSAPSAEWCRGAPARTFKSPLLPSATISHGGGRCSPCLAVLPVTDFSSHYLAAWFLRGGRAGFCRGWSWFPGASLLLVLLTPLRGRSSWGWGFSALPC